ncbi:MAG: hypothetical protein Q4D78_10700, partial [Neisseria zoodegmatis]|nr:hypothetical protein [Neisseria zoodegmatis]
WCTFRCSLWCTFRWLLTAGLKTCLYTGLEREELSDGLLPYLTYLKTGRWIAGLGGLDSPITNQRFTDLRSGAVLNRLFIKGETP